MEQKKIDAIVAAYATDYDSWPQNRQQKQEQYERGRKYARECEYIAVSMSGSWSGRKKEGGSVQAYEIIGGHCYTNQLVRAWLEEGVPIKDYRYRNEYFSCRCLASGPKKILVEGRCPRCGHEPFPTIETEQEVAS